MLDSFYAELRRCRDHCTGRANVEHRTPGSTSATTGAARTGAARLSRSTIRQIHFILQRRAYKRAVRWRWVSTSPIEQAEPPPAPRPNPQPPSPEEAARILNAAWSDPDWGMLVWLAMVTGPAAASCARCAGGRRPRPAACIP